MLNAVQHTVDVVTLLFCYLLGFSIFGAVPLKRYPPIVTIQHEVIPHFVILQKKGKSYMVIIFFYLESVVYISILPQLVHCRTVQTLPVLHI